MGKLRGLWRLSAGVGFLYNRPLDMRILYLIDSFHLGGSEESATCLAVEQARRGHRCFVAAVRPPPDDDNVGRNQKRRLSSTGIGHTTLCRRSARLDLLYAPLSLIALIKKFRPHLIHVHTDILVFLFVCGRVVYSLVVQPGHSRNRRARCRQAC